MATKQNRSSTCQHSLISSVALVKRGINIVALQEPSINSFGTAIAAQEWIPVYPSTHNVEPTKTRSLILIRSNILTDQWRQVDFPSGDVTIISIQGSWGKLMLYNIYNNCIKNDTICSSNISALQTRKVYEVNNGLATAEQPF